MGRGNALENLSRFFMKLAGFFFKVAIFFVVIYLVGMQLFSLGRRLFYEKPMESGEGKEIVFEIKKDDTVDTIADNLEKAGLIDDKLAFKFRAKIYKTNFTPNTYSLRTSMTIKNMLDIFDKPTEDNIVQRVSNDEVYQLAPEDDYVPIEEDETKNTNDKSKEKK